MIPKAKILSDEELKEEIAKWLFKNRTRFPNQRFYANWYDETAASPLTEKEYRNLANELLLSIHYLPLIEQAKQAGRKEVVEWIQKNYLIPNPVSEAGKAEWQSKLKEWGIGS